MNGPGHYREAEKILELTSLEDHYRNYHLQAAQVHATLALTAATIGRGSLTPAGRHEWQTAIDPEYVGRAAPLCRAHPDDCPNGPGPHAYYNPPELEGRCPCCRQPGEPETPPGELLEELF